MEHFTITCNKCGSDCIEAVVETEYGYVIDEGQTEAYLQLICKCGNKETLQEE